MKATKIITALSILALSATGVNAAYEEVKCDVDPVFNANSCNQCFNEKIKEKVLI